MSASRKLPPPPARCTPAAPPAPSSRATLRGRRHRTGRWCRSRRRAGVGRASARGRFGGAAFAARRRGVQQQRCARMCSRLPPGARTCGSCCDGRGRGRLLLDPMATADAAFGAEGARRAASKPLPRPGGDCWHPGRMRQRLSYAPIAQGGCGGAAAGGGGSGGAGNALRAGARRCFACKERVQTPGGGVQREWV